MIWLASFPRSGNTFFRNVLYEVYGLESSTFHRDPQRDLDNRYSTFPVVKTHDLPTLIEPKSKDIKAVYIIRDGRDSLVSIAHHRKDIVEQGSDFYNNLLEAILARNGSHFGGWSENVRQWVERADLVVRFEDLIRDPLSQVERLREIMDLPEPNRDKLPSFQDLKFGKPRYGGGKGKRFQTSKAQLHFRKGKVGSWKEEMPPELEALFWKQHGKMMEEWGYEREPLTQASKNAKAKKRVLIEVSKLFTHDNDGVKRYLLELIEHLPVLLEHQKDEWHVDLYHNNRVQPLHNIRMKLEERGLSNFHQPNSIEKAMGQQHEYENRLLQLKAGIKSTLPQPVYNTLSYSYKKLPIRAALRWYRNLVTTEKVKVAQTKQDQQFNSYDLIHVPLPQNLPFVKDLESRFLVTVHDLTHRLFPKFHTPDNIERAEDGMQMMLEKEAEVLAISKATKRDVQKLYNIDEDKVHLVYEAANTGHFRKRDESALKAVQIQYNLPDVPYLMCLSTIEPRKNLLNTAKAFLRLIEEHPDLDVHLVICGKKGWKFEELFKEDLTQSKRIHFTGFVNDEDLPLLYAHALALCYVSYYEGFGLPPLEAMSCGTPVIFGDNSSMPEVVGKGGLPAVADDVEAIKSQMHRLVADPVFREELAREAWRQSRRFSWLKTTLQTLEAYRKVIER